MNETLKVLETRRSCRNFKPDMVKDEDLKAILRAGTYAATGMGKQSPIIIAVKDKAPLVGKYRHAPLPLDLMGVKKTVAVIHTPRLSDRPAQI